MCSPPSKSGDAAALSALPSAGGQTGRQQRLVVPEHIEPERLRVVMETAERHCDKIDACAFLNLLPKTVPLVVVANFVATAVELACAKKHNLQVLRCVISALFSSLCVIWFNNMLCLIRYYTSFFGCAKSIFEPLPVHKKLYCALYLFQTHN